MMIKCESLKEMATLCAEFVREGVLFEADTIRMTITLTGGY
jgi:hypothetical protein